MQQPATTLKRAEFDELTTPFRRELLAHCYRLLGSVDDAEDLVQDTYLRAWRSFEGFEGRSSLRTWLYRIATNVCLNALQGRARRPLPSGLGGPGDDPYAPISASGPEIAWLQPIPDALVSREAGDPADIAVSRESIRLALIASLQYLPPRQRAVLILREVLAFPATEVASMLGTSTAAIKSALQRARARLAEVTPEDDDLAEPADPRVRTLLEQYIAAFENSDAAALTELLRRDATLEMMPSTTWFAGGKAIACAVAGLGSPGDWRMIPTVANGQPAAAAYRRGADGIHHAYAVVVLGTASTGISRIVIFGDPGLFARFSLPLAIPPDGKGLEAGRPS